MRIKKEVFIKRREKLFQQMQPNSTAILCAAKECIRNPEINYRYRQDSDFYYLTGFKEPEAVAVFIKGESTEEFILFNRENDPEKEQWVGPRAGQEGAIREFGADQSYPISELDARMIEILRGEDYLYYAYGRYPWFDREVNRWLNRIRSEIRTGVNVVNTIINIEDILHEMRMIKSDEEVAILKKAANISASAHYHAIKTCSPNRYEYQLEGELLHQYYQQGAREVAFGSIVAGGAHACTLHYEANDSLLKDGDLVLIDAGCEYEYYASDITRTFPVNGHFSKEQAEIYNLVLKAQIAAIELVKPGICWSKLQEKAVKIITEGLCELGILSGNVDELIESRAYARFYMHRIGHWLGIDAHDVGKYKIGDQWRILQPGMIFTVEPGIYIKTESEAVDKKWWNIGVRIEDDILVTKDGFEVLTSNVPKTVEEIEKLMQH